jgi:hypothetical protein
MEAAGVALGRKRRLHRRALRLEYFTVSWNVIEALVAITAGVIAGSVALVGFGVDSGIEVISAIAAAVAAAQGRRRRRRTPKSTPSAARTTRSPPRSSCSRRTSASRPSPL